MAKKTKLQQRARDLSERVLAPYSAALFWVTWLQDDEINVVLEAGGTKLLNAKAKQRQAASKERDALLGSKQSRISTWLCDEAKEVDEALTSGDDPQARDELIDVLGLTLSMLGIYTDSEILESYAMWDKKQSERGRAPLPYVRAAITALTSVEEEERLRSFLLTVSAKANAL